MKHHCTQLCTLTFVTFFLNFQEIRFFLSFIGGKFCLTLGQRFESFTGPDLDFFIHHDSVDYYFAIVVNSVQEPPYVLIVGFSPLQLSRCAKVLFFSQRFCEYSLKTGLCVYSLEERVKGFKKFVLTIVKNCKLGALCCCTCLIFGYGSNVVDSLVFDHH